MAKNKEKQEESNQKNTKSVIEIIEEIHPKTEEYKLTYESYSEPVESVYYFLLDLMKDSFGLETEKLVDNFTAAPGSQHAQEMGQKKGLMQQNASQHMERIGTLAKSTLNILYDLRDFKIRLQHYNDAKSDDKDKKQSAIQSLKQIWIDKVDAQKGNSSIAMMARQLGFQTLFDAFFTVKKPEDADDLDLNERVKRIVKSRIAEFNTWVKQSEAELKKRYEMEKNHLRSQVNNLKIYSRWARPFFRQAEQLEAQERENDPNLVNAFNNTVIQVTLLGKKGVDPKQLAIEGELPEFFEDDKTRKHVKHKFNQCLVVDFFFRTTPQQGKYPGRADVTFKGYALTDEEIEKVKEELGKSDLENAFRWIENTTENSLGPMREEIEEFLEEDLETGEEKKSEDKEEKSKDQSNPFAALLGLYDKPKKSDKKQKEKKEKKENLSKKGKHFEGMIRKYAENGADGLAFNSLDIYKKSHGMPSYT